MLKKLGLAMVMIEPRQQVIRNNKNSGIVYCLVSYLWFSGSIFWFKLVSHVPPWEILAHRIIWSSLFLLAVLVIAGRLKTTLKILKNRNVIVTLITTTFLIGFSWYTYIWAITHDRILDTSLAYYISPLIKVFLGNVFLREKLPPAQIVSIILAIIGIAIMGISIGGIPTISLGLAIASGFYGLLRKNISVDALTGLTFEVIFLTPAACLYILFLLSKRMLVFANLSPTTDVLLLMAGVIHMIPLICYCIALKKLTYSSLGIMMYIMPTLTFLIAIIVFREPFGTIQLITFCCVWFALIIFIYDLFTTNSRLRRKNT